jgi:O-antigen/teichoic acid export membrane protein
MTDHKAFVRRGAVTVTGAAVAGFGADYILNLAVARILQPHDYGDYKIAMAFLSLAALVVLLGGDRATSRFLAGWMATPERDGVWEYVRVYVAIVAVLSLLVAGVTIALSLLIFGPRDPSTHHPLLVAALAIPFLALARLLRRIFEASRHIDLANLPWRVGLPLIQFVLLIVVLCFVDKVTDIEILWLVLASAALLLAFQMVYIARLGLLPMRRCPHLAAPRAWLAVSLPMMGSKLIQTGMGQVGLFMIELILLDETQVGYYGAATTTVFVILLASTAAAGVLTPLIAGALSEGPEAIRDLHTRGFRILLTIAVPAAVALLLFAPAVLSLFGQGFVAASRTLMILAVGYLVSVVLGLSSTWLQFAGKARQVTWVMVGALVLNIVLCVPLIARFGIDGAALSSAVALIWSALLLAVMMRRHVGVSPWPIGPALAGLLSRKGE